jgi:hypothetical protein
MTETMMQDGVWHGRGREPESGVNATAPPHAEAILSRPSSDHNSAVATKSSQAMKHMQEN